MCCLIADLVIFFLGEKNVKSKFRKTMDNTVKLTCKEVQYYSLFDEYCFFEWIKKIASIHRYDGKNNVLCLYFEGNKINDKDLRELIALFYRYKIKNMKQLAIFLNSTNKKWFYDNCKSYWHGKIFGVSSNTMNKSS
jgi:hypothetical protein